MNRKKSHKNGGAGVWWDSGMKKKVIYVNGNYMGEEQQSNQ